MKENIVQLLYVVLGVTLITSIINNENQIGKYVPFGNKMILDTTNGNVYIPTEGHSTEYNWMKYFSFDRVELQAELDSINKELKSLNNKLKVTNDENQRETIKELKMILKIQAEKIENKLN